MHIDVASIAMSNFNAKEEGGNDKDVTVHDELQMVPEDHVLLSTEKVGGKGKSSCKGTARAALSSCP